MPSARTGQLADYCSNFKLSSLQWLVIGMLDPGCGSSASPGGAMGFSGGSLSNGSEWSPPLHKR